MKIGIGDDGQGEKVLKCNQRIAIEIPCVSTQSKHIAEGFGVPLCFGVPDVLHAKGERRWNGQYNGQDPNEAYNEFCSEFGGFGPQRIHYGPVTVKRNGHQREYGHSQRDHLNSWTEGAHEIR